MAAQLHVFVAAAGLHRAVAADDERKCSAAGSSRALRHACDGGGLRRVVAVAQPQLSEAVAAHAPQLTAVRDHEAVRQAAGDGGYAELGAERAGDVEGGARGGGGVRWRGGGLSDEHGC